MRIFKFKLSINSVCLAALFAVVWIILTESISLWSVAAGIVISSVCVYCCHRFLALEKIADVNFGRLFLYVFYLVGQIYIAGFAAIKLIVVGAKADIVTVGTDIESDFLKVLLANSITLTPGTLTLDLSGDRLTVLWLRDKAGGPADMDGAGREIKGKLERQLLKAQKRQPQKRQP